MKRRFRVYATRETFEHTELVFMAEDTFEAEELARKALAKRPTRRWQKDEPNVRVTATVDTRPIARKKSA